MIPEVDSLGMQHPQERGAEPKRRGDDATGAPISAREARQRLTPAGEQQGEDMYSAVSVGAYSCRVEVQHRLPCVSKPVPGKVIGGSALAESGSCERPRTVLLRARLVGGDRKGVRTRWVGSSLARLVRCGVRWLRLEAGSCSARRSREQQGACW